MIWVVATNKVFQAYCADQQLDPNDRSQVRRISTMVVARYVQPEVGDMLVHIQSAEAGDGDVRVYNHLLQKVVIA